MPFDPNGMVMGFGRSCYRRRMRFVSDDPSKIAVVQWYFAKPTAIPFPALHRFGPAIWDTERGMYTDLGDDAQAAMTYSKGENLNLSDGTTFAGPLEYFTDGAPASFAIARIPGGTPVQCLTELQVILATAPRIVKSAAANTEIRTFKQGIVKGCYYQIDH